MRTAHKFIQRFQASPHKEQLHMNTLKLTPILSTLLVGAVTELHAKVQTVAQAVTITLTAKSLVGGTFVSEEGAYVMEEDPETGKLIKTPTFNSTIETLDENDNVTKRVTSSIAKTVTGKLGNAQILAEFVDSLDGTIAGWSIVLLTEVNSLGIGNPIGFWAVKKNRENVYLGDVIDLEGITGGPYNIIETYTAKYTRGSINEPSELIEGSEKHTIAAKGTSEGPITIKFADTDMVGSYIQPWNSLTIDPDSTVAEITYDLGAGRVTGLLGASDFSVLEDPIHSGVYVNTIYAGRINIAAAKGKVVSRNR